MNIKLQTHIGAGQGMPSLESQFSPATLNEFFNDANCPFLRCILVDKPIWIYILPNSSTIPTSMIEGYFMCQILQKKMYQYSFQMWKSKVMEDIKYMLHPIQVCVSPSERERRLSIYIFKAEKEKKGRGGGGKVPLEQYPIGNIVLYNVLIIRKGFVFQHITEVSQKIVTTYLWATSFRHVYRIFFSKHLSFRFSRNLTRDAILRESFEPREVSPIP